MAAVKIGHSMLSCNQSQQPSESKADAKHQGLAMALAKLQRKPFGEDRSHVAEAHGDVREGKNRASFQEKISCKLQDIMKNTFDLPGENSTIFVTWISSFASGPFSPRRDVYPSSSSITKHQKGT